MSSAALSDLRTRLEERRRRLDEEIRGYPTPIPRCDAQFNHLFEERDRITRILDGLAQEASDVASMKELVASARSLLEAK